MIFSLAFFQAAGERAARTVAQTMLSLWLIGDVAFDVLEVDWAQAAGIGGGAALVSLLMSVVATAASPDTGPSFGTETPTGAVEADYTPNAAVVAAVIADTAFVVAGPASPLPDGTPVEVVNADLI